MSKNPKGSAFGVVRSAIHAYRRESRKDAWKADHNAAMKCFDLEEMLWVANGVYDAITHFDETHRGRVLSGEIEFDPDHSGLIRQAYAWWLGPCDVFQAAINKYRGRFGNVTNSEEFLSRCREAKGILTDDSEFFAGDPIIALCDEAVDDFRAGNTIECSGQ